MNSVGVIALVTNGPSYHYIPNTIYRVSPAHLAAIGTSECSDVHPADWH